jgi:predicted DNA-binding transcriptional regulator YafY
VRIGPTGADGRVEVELRGHTTRSLAGEIAGLGAALEIVDPDEIRDLLATIGDELAALYG